MSPRIGLDLPTIVQAAAEIADTKGISEVTLASLAQKLSVRSPSLYNHVNGLPGLRNKLAIYGLTKLNGELTRAAVGKSGDDAVRAFANAYIAFARSHPGLYESTLLPPDAADPEYVQIGTESVEIVLRVLQEYDLMDDAALHAVRGLRSVLHGFASLEQKGGFGLPLSLDVTLQMLIDTFLAGMRAMTAAPDTRR
ncbi:WHG domain-containing protein [Paenibacillus sp. MBLB4367]|uniref:TetR/AcrR family transcriptional regulator n=1 Tax=Paenibacillus sp. MBLB4367 TaxID=3384767 RepID=UPI003907FA28